MFGGLDGQVAKEEDMIVEPRRNSPLWVTAASRNPIRDVLDGEVVGEAHRGSLPAPRVSTILDEESE